MAILLTKDPSGIELEHLVASHFVSRGCFVESGVTERAPDDVSDIDVVWTDYRRTPAAAHPVEVKSGAWKLEHLFKFYGWTRYLGLPSGQFAYSQVPKKLDKVQVVASRMGVELLHVDSSNVDKSFASLQLPNPAQTYLPGLWRYSYLAQRRYFEALQQAIELATCKESAIRAKEYHRLVNDALFFEPRPTQRLQMLFDAHHANPKLANTAAAELAGQPVDFEDPPEDTPQFKAALYEGRHFPIQSCFYASHRARLYVLKAAVDAMLARERGEIQDVRIKLGETVFNLGMPGVPSWRFDGGIEHFRQFEWFALLPTFWQVFLWGWGGFLLGDRIDEERADLAAQTGLPEDGIEEALTAYERFFGEAFRIRTPRNDSRRVLPLMPAAMRGIGVLQRAWRHKLSNLSGFSGPSTTVRLEKDYLALDKLLKCSEAELAQ